MRVCYIVGAGDFNAALFQPDGEDCVIAADGGYENVRKSGREPNLLIGDFDSLAENGDWAEKRFPIVRLPEEKNDTDILAALREGIRQGYEEFRIFGGTGGRMDHTIANLQCLVFLSKKGLRGELYGMDCRITAVTDGTVRFPAGKQGIVAVFAMGDAAEGVTLRGLRYKLQDAVVTNDYPIGVSNEFTGAESSVSVKKGTLLVINYF